MRSTAPNIRSSFLKALFAFLFVVAIFHTLYMRVLREAESTRRQNRELTSQLDDLKLLVKKKNDLLNQKDTILNQQQQEMMIISQALNNPKNNKSTQVPTSEQTTEASKSSTENRETKKSDENKKKKKNDEEEEKKFVRKVLVKNPFDLTIIMPTVNRMEPTVPAAVKSLLSIAQADDNKIKLVLFNGELNPANHTKIKDVAQMYPSEIDHGILQILDIQDKQSYYREKLREDKLKRNHGDPIDRILWRSKEALDFANSVRAACGIDRDDTLTIKCPHNPNEQCVTEPPEHILFLEDDVIPTSHIYRKLFRWLKDYEKNDWVAISLYSQGNEVNGQEYYLPCCSQAILFKCKDMANLAQYVTQNYDENPIDGLVNAYLYRMSTAGRKSYIAVPHLFQHNRVISTYAAKGVTTHTSRFFEP